MRFLLDFFNERNQGLIMRLFILSIIFLSCLSGCGVPIIPGI